MLQPGLHALLADVQTWPFCFLQNEKSTQPLHLAVEEV